jgi:hypothetical protein
MEFKELVQRIYYFDHFNQFGQRDPVQNQASKENLLKLIEAEHLTKIQKEKILTECGKLFTQQYEFAKGTFPNNTPPQKKWNEGSGPEIKLVIKRYLNLK